MDQVQRLLQKVCSDIGTPQAHAVMALAKEGKWAQIQGLRLAPPHTYASPEAYRDDRLVVELIRKLELPDPTASRSRVESARKAFFKAEAQCHQTNGYLRHLQHGHLDLNDLGVLEFITQWRKIVSDILGPIPRKLDPRYSPGSTLSDKGKAITIPDKMSSAPTCYPHSLSVVEHTVHGTELARLTVPKFFRANRFFTVPKNSETMRGCCVEASLNVVSQLAVGQEIRKRYNRYYKVELTMLNVIHKLIAKEISRTGSHSTVDLSMASDTVARELVRMVLPTAWHDLLNSLRATHTQIAGRTVRLEKFSSMGNGFTFELETLLFRSLMTALGVGRDEGSCFGDDIIVPTGKTDVLIKALRRFGFLPNQDKTFCEGPFRESCGGDYFDGHDVRAVYLKKVPDDPQAWVVLHNQLMAWGGEDRLRAARWYCVDQVPKSWRVFGPAWLKDQVFTRESEPAVALGPVALTRRYSKQGLAPSTRGYWCKQPIHRKITVSDKWFKRHVVIAAALLGTGEQIALRDSVMGHKSVFVPAYGLSDSNANKTFRWLKAI